jgi:hypothetical protein
MDNLAPVENLEGDPPLSAYAASAAHWGLPVWAMMVPGTTRDMFEDISKINRLVKMVGDYLACSDSQRSSIEGMAAGLAGLEI